MGRGRVRYLARAAVFAALIGLAAGCSSSSSSSGGAGPATTAPASSSASASASAPASAPPFAGIIEPFDQGHPARVRPAPASCASQPTTLAVEQCYAIKTENADAQIDTVELGFYDSAPLYSVKASIVTQDNAWLAARGPVCQAAFHAAGTIDGISVAACLLAESTARLDAIRDVTPAVAKLKNTDSIDPNNLSWYTTPEGSRIAEIDTQGDQTGGVIIAWVIIGGADGFVVNPKQFYYQDGSFTDPGVIEGPNPTYHRVATGVEYEFDIDYSLLAKDPSRGAGGGYLYVPGTPVAIWR